MKTWDVSGLWDTAVCAEGRRLAAAALYPVDASLLIVAESRAGDDQFTSAERLTIWISSPSLRPECLSAGSASLLYLVQPAATSTRASICARTDANLRPSFVVLSNFLNRDPARTLHRAHLATKLQQLLH